MTTTARDLGPQLLDVTRSGAVEYPLRGAVQLDGVLAITVPFGRSGQLGLLAAGARLLADTAASDTRFGRFASS